MDHTTRTSRDALGAVSPTLLRRLSTEVLLHRLAVEVDRRLVATAPTEHRDAAEAILAIAAELDRRGAPVGGARRGRPVGEGPPVTSPVEGPATSSRPLGSPPLGSSSLGDPPVEPHDGRPRLRLVCTQDDATEPALHGG